MNASALDLGWVFEVKVWISLRHMFFSNQSLVFGGWLSVEVLRELGCGFLAEKWALESTGSCKRQY